MSQTSMRKASSSVFRGRQPTATQAGAELKRSEGASFCTGLALRETTLGAFIEESNIEKNIEKRFQSFVERVGGSTDTDKRTLEILFELWEEQGRP